MKTNRYEPACKELKEKGLDKLVPEKIDDSEANYAHCIRYSMKAIPEKGIFENSGKVVKYNDVVWPTVAESIEAINLVVFHTPVGWAENEKLKKAAKSPKAEEKKVAVKKEDSKES